jgi:hypothetical protein
MGFINRPRDIFPCGAEISVLDCFLLEAGRPIFNPALNGKLQEGQQDSGKFDKPLFWVHFCAHRSLLSP